LRAWRKEGEGRNESWGGAESYIEIKEEELKNEG